MRLGLFGGSFDPVHMGHLLLAETCREAASLDRVRFLPASVSPHKVSQDVTSGLHRLQMLRLAVSGHPGFEVSDAEIQRGGVSYTVDTLQNIRNENATAELFFLMGADTLADFPSWRDPARICQLAMPLVVHRTQSPAPNFTPLAALVPTERLSQIRNAQVDMPLIELSSREIRRRVRNGQSIRYRTPRAVEKYIETQGLYRLPNDQE